MIRKKAVLFLHAGAEWYGADKVLFNTITALKEHWECHVLLPNVGILVEKFADLGVTVQVFAYPILRRKQFTLSGIIRFLGEYLIAVLRLFGYVRKHRIHCVCAHTFAVTEGVALALLGVPQVWHVLEIITKPRSLNRFLALAARTTAAKIICASRAVQENLGAPPEQRCDLPRYRSPERGRSPQNTAYRRSGRRWNAWKIQSLEGAGPPGAGCEPAPPSAGRFLHYR